MSVIIDSNMSEQDQPNTEVLPLLICLQSNTTFTKKLANVLPVENKFSINNGLPPCNHQAIVHYGYGGPIYIFDTTILEDKLLESVTRNITTYDLHKHVITLYKEERRIAKREEEAKIETIDEKKDYH